LHVGFAGREYISFSFDRYEKALHIIGKPTPRHVWSYDFGEKLFMIFGKKCINIHLKKATEALFATT
jgi:hypothetical protein